MLPVWTGRIIVIVTFMRMKNRSLSIFQSELTSDEQKVCYDFLKRKANPEKSENFCRHDSSM